MSMSVADESEPVASTTCVASLPGAPGSPLSPFGPCGPCGSVAKSTGLSEWFFTSALRTAPVAICLAVAPSSSAA